jgi:hypothetical protein
MTGLRMLNHYVLIAGYDGDTFIILEPVLGLRTISAERLARYRLAFGDAAIVFSKGKGRSTERVPRPSFRLDSSSP